MLSCHIMESKMNDLETLKHIKTSPVYSLPYRSWFMVQAQRKRNRLSIIIIATFSHVLSGCACVCIWVFTHLGSWCGSMHVKVRVWCRESFWIILHLIHWGMISLLNKKVSHIVNLGNQFVHWYPVFALLGLQL